MAQVATMGPPLSPRETRRSGRRAAPSHSASTSKSPDSPASESTPRSSQNIARPSLPSSNTSARNKRSKQEDVDEPPDEPLKNGTNGTALTNGAARSKRKGKEKEKPVLGLAIDAIKTDTPDIVMDVIEPDEEQGVTRCVCGSTGEDDADAGEFMVQCETCHCWQHGLCMGFESEDQLPKDDYLCEQCRPDLHVELLKKLARRPRHSSANSHHTNGARNSRSHSPSYLFKPAKRRNTMNSRDAAYDEKLQEAILMSAAEAVAGDQPPPSVGGSTTGHPENDEQTEGVPNGRKKRKRPSDDAASVKRTRSASTTSDRPAAPTAREETPAATPAPPAKTSMPAPAPKTSTARNRRGGGGRKAAALVQELASADGEEAGGGVPSRRANNSRAKTSSAPSKRGQASANTAQEHTTSRRNHSGTGPNGTAAHAPASSSSRAYHNSHAYVVSQQPLLSSWGLPDYLAHLEPMLPTDTPRPLHVRGSGLTSTGRESMERTMERGVKVKWPSKRMSVGDMNKRVRALVEWVGREQANALEHDRRREALEAALKEATEAMGLLATAEPDETPMLVDDALAESPAQEKSSAAPPDAKSTMKMMEELMEELIGFQERFGPGAKSKERERRTAAS
ncbi:hypothetical protein FA95DRAFT_1190226 [Auriscalpium vulgare]|uniref:Uncharacterized protein n=1 Tax=Auriscalpium vulgare TaxID=40419 RepID=A0ACB8RVB4_9AGAM|nr:hypothetical protein FA95DRAFT_1190226 [Auriscalpium vulgare]